MEALADQLTSRDAALLTWIGGFLLVGAWSGARSGALGESLAGVIRAFFVLRLMAMVALVAGWLLVLVFVASLIGLWDSTLVKDTVVIVAAGSVMAGFKALAMTKGEVTLSGEVRALLGLVVVLQWVSNVQTFPYLVELALIPMAATLGGMQVVASQNNEFRRALPLINGTLTLLGLLILGWSIYRVVDSAGSMAWASVGKSFALAFWLPAALLPATYVAAVVMEYGKVISVMKLVRPPSFEARLDLYFHHRLSLRSLTRFARTRGRARQYARAQNRTERLALLRAPTE